MSLLDRHLQLPLGAIPLLRDQGRLRQKYRRITLCGSRTGSDSFGVVPALPVGQDSGGCHMKAFLYASPWTRVPGPVNDYDCRIVTHGCTPPAGARQPVLSTRPNLITLGKVMGFK